jgi:hypothetical protein
MARISRERGAGPSTLARAGPADWDVCRSHVPPVAPRPRCRGSRKGGPNPNDQHRAGHHHHRQARRNPAPVHEPETRGRRGDAHGGQRCSIRRTAWRCSRRGCRAGTAPGAFGRRAGAIPQRLVARHSAGTTGAVDRRGRTGAHQGPGHRTPSADNAQEIARAVQRGTSPVHRVAPARVRGAVRIAPGTERRPARAGAGVQASHLPGPPHCPWRSLRRRRSTRPPTSQPGRVMLPDSMDAVIGFPPRRRRKVSMPRSARRLGVGQNAAEAPALAGQCSERHWHRPPPRRPFRRQRMTAAETHVNLMDSHSAGADPTTPTGVRRRLVRASFGKSFGAGVIPGVHAAGPKAPMSSRRPRRKLADMPSTGQSSIE